MKGYIRDIVEELISINNKATAEQISNVVGAFVTTEEVQQLIKSRKRNIRKYN
ncbi:MAG: hypothetical protein KAX49_03970 [Halanaerobiales bacterium]|nr:hypothetical protein [Halanaerobiales bacterium]